MADAEPPGAGATHPGPDTLHDGASGLEKLQACEISTIAKLNKLLNDLNWTVWKEQMRHIFRLCRVDKYTVGTILQPADAAGREIWDYNDNYMQVIIVTNVSPSEMVHVSQHNTTTEMWNSLVAVHEVKGHQTMIAVICNLLHTIAEEHTDINEHLNKLLGYWECIILMDNEDFCISDAMFKVIILSLLPHSWDNFTESFVTSRKGMVENDLKKLI
jgi:hypothetical protein